MAKVVCSFGGGSTEVTFNPNTQKHSVGISCASDTAFAPGQYNYGGNYEFNWADSYSSIQAGIIAKAVANGQLEGLTLSASDIKLLP